MIKITADYLQALQEDHGGFCVACKGEAYGVEPDAFRYECESCGKFRVYGIDNCLIMGLIEIVDTMPEVSA